MLLLIFSHRILLSKVSSQSKAVQGILLEAIATGGSKLSIYWNTDGPRFPRVLTIRGLLIVYKICYPRIFPSVIRGIYSNMDNKMPKQLSLFICFFVIRGIFWECNPHK